MPTDVHQQAINLGFDVVGITDARLPEKWLDHLRDWIAMGGHGDMVWLEQRIKERAQPQVLWSEARSVIMVGMNYAPSSFEDIPSDCGRVSDYARNRDYHDVMKRRLKTYGRWLVQTHGGDVKVFVDTAPVMEKPLAQQAGLGWMGRNTLLISRSFGSYLFLGVIYTSLELKPDEPSMGHCGSCRACVDACPTQALDGEGGLDCRKCLSYLTIEHKDDIPKEYHSALDNRVYGCDSCVRACPWNKFAPATPHLEFQAMAERNAIPLKQLAQLDDAEFRTLFAQSPIKRLGHARFLRNVQTVLESD